MINYYVSIKNSPHLIYSQLSLRRTPLGPALSVRLKEVSFLERCPSYRESNKRSKERQGPTLGVRFTGVHLTEVSVKRESLYQNKK